MLNIKKLIAVVTTLSFMETAVIAPAAQAMTVPPVSPKNVQEALDGLFIPSTIGRVTSGKYFDSGTVVISIQDLHCHAEVQRNISRILEELDTKYKLKTVYLEGGYGDIDTSWLGNIKDQKYRQELADAMVDSGRLTGAEYYAVLKDRPGLLKGLEDEQLHRANVARLGKILEKKPYFEAKLRDLDKDAAFMEAKYFSARNRRFNKVIEQYKASQMPAEKYYAVLGKYVETINAHRDTCNAAYRIRMDNYPHVSKYVELLRTGKRLPYKRIAPQLQRFVGELKQRLPYNSYRYLLDKTENFTRLDKLYVLLSALSREYHFDLSGEYPDLADFFAYVDRGQDINPEEMIREEKRLVEEIRMGFAGDISELEVSFAADFYGYFKDYLFNRLSADDYRYFTERFGKFQTIWAKYTYVDRLAELEPEFALLDEYYKVNAERNEVFLSRIPGNPSDSRPAARAAENPDDQIRMTVGSLATAQEILVVVTGGFHTEGLDELFSRRGVSHISIMPNVTEDPQWATSVYEQLARRQATLGPCQQNGMKKRLSRVPVLFRSNPVQTLAKSLVNVDFKHSDALGLTVASSEPGMEQFRAAAEAEWQKLVRTRHALDQDTIQELLTKMGINGVTVTISDKTILLKDENGKKIAEVDRSTGKFIDEEVQPAASGGTVRKIDVARISNSVEHLAAWVFNQTERVQISNLFPQMITVLLWMADNNFIIGDGPVYELINKKGLSDLAREFRSAPEAPENIAKLPPNVQRAMMRLIKKRKTIKQYMMTEGGNDLAKALLFAAHMLGVEISLKKASGQEEHADSRPKKITGGNTEKTDIVIERIKPEDWNDARKSILEIERKAEPHLRFRDEELEEVFADKNSIILVAKLEGSIVGFVIGGPLENYEDQSGVMKDGNYRKKNSIYEESFAVMEEFRDRGIGRKLEKTFFEEAAAMGYTYVAAHRKEGIAAKRGYEILHRFNNWVGTGEAYEYSRVDLKKAILPSNDEQLISGSGGIARSLAPDRWYFYPGAVLHEIDHVIGAVLGGFIARPSFINAANYHTMVTFNWWNTLTSLLRGISWTDAVRDANSGETEVSRARIGLFYASGLLPLSSLFFFIAISAIAQLNLQAPFLVPALYGTWIVLTGLRAMDIAMNIPLLRTLSGKPMNSAELFMNDLHQLRISLTRGLTGRENYAKYIAHDTGMESTGTKPEGQAGVDNSGEQKDTVEEREEKGDYIFARIKILNNAKADVESRTTAMQELLKAYAGGNLSQHDLEVITDALQGDRRLSFLLDLPDLYFSRDYIKKIVGMDMSEFDGYQERADEFWRIFNEVNRNASDTQRVSRDFSKYIPVALLMDYIVPNAIRTMTELLRSTIKSGKFNPQVVTRLIDGKRRVIMDEQMLLELEKVRDKIKEIVQNNRDNELKKRVASANKHKHKRTSVPYLMGKNRKKQRTEKKKPGTKVDIKISSDRFYKIMDIAEGFVALNAAQGVDEALGSFSSDAKDVNTVIDELHAKMAARFIELLAQELGLDATNINIPQMAKDKMYIPYMSRLTTARTRIEQREKKIKLLWFNGVMRSVMEGRDRFWKFIEDVDQDDPVGKTIASHNKKVRGLMADRKIDVDHYLGKEGKDRFAEGTFEHEGRKFTLRPILREPGYDIFIGDFTNNCLAMNSDLNPIGMVERLIDEGMNIIEVLDDNDRTMAALWLYIAEDGSLVIQNIELAAQYETGGIMEPVADKMIEYAYLFSQYINAKQLLLGIPDHSKYYGPGSYIEKLYRTNQIFSVNFKLGKIGGYPKNSGYFLDSAKKPRAYLVPEPVKYDKHFVRLSKVKTMAETQWQGIVSAQGTLRKGNIAKFFKSLGVFDVLIKAKGNRALLFEEDKQDVVAAEVDLATGKFIDTEGSEAAVSISDESKIRKAAVLPENVAPYYLRALRMSGALEEWGVPRTLAVALAQNVSLLMLSLKETYPLLRDPELFDRRHGKADPDRTAMINRVWRAAVIGILGTSGALLLLGIFPVLPVWLLAPGIVSFAASLRWHVRYDRYADIPTVIVIKNKLSDEVALPAQEGYAVVQIVRELDGEAAGDALEDLGFPDIEGKGTVRGGVIDGALTIHIDEDDAAGFTAAANDIVDRLKGLGNIAADALVLNAVDREIYKGPSNVRYLSVGEISERMKKEGYQQLQELWDRYAQKHAFNENVGEGWLATKKKATLSLMHYLSMGLLLIPAEFILRMALGIMVDRFHVVVLETTLSFLQSQGWLLPAAIIVLFMLLPVLERKIPEQELAVLLRVKDFRRQFERSLHAVTTMKKLRSVGVNDLWDNPSYRRVYYMKDKEVALREEGEDYHTIARKTLNALLGYRDAKGDYYQGALTGSLEKGVKSVKAIMKEHPELRALANSPEVSRANAQELLRVIQTGGSEMGGRSAEALEKEYSELMALADASAEISRTRALELLRAIQSHVKPDSKGMTLLIEAIAAIENESYLLKGDVEVSVWKRDPWVDLSYKKEFHCCAYLGGLNELAGFQYINNKGISSLDLKTRVGEKTRKVRVIMGAGVYTDADGRENGVLLIDSVEGTTFMERAVIKKAIEDYGRAAGFSKVLFNKDLFIAVVPQRFIRHVRESGALLKEMKVRLPYSGDLQYLEMFKFPSILRKLPHQLRQVLGLTLIFNYSHPRGKVVGYVVVLEAENAVQPGENDFAATMPDTAMMPEDVPADVNHDAGKIRRAAILPERNAGQYYLDRLMGMETDEALARVAEKESRLVVLHPKKFIRGHGWRNQSITWAMFGSFWFTGIALTTLALRVVNPQYQWTNPVLVLGSMFTAFFLLNIGLLVQRKLHVLFDRKAKIPTDVFFRNDLFEEVDIRRGVGIAAVRIVFNIDQEMLEQGILQKTKVTVDKDKNVWAGIVDGILTIHVEGVRTAGVREEKQYKTVIDELLTELEGYGMYVQYQSPRAPLVNISNVKAGLEIEGETRPIVIISRDEAERDVPVTLSKGRYRNIQIVRNLDLEHFYWFKDTKFRVAGGKGRVLAGLLWGIPTLFIQGLENDPEKQAKAVEELSTELHAVKIQDEAAADDKDLTKKAAMLPENVAPYYLRALRISGVLERAGLAHAPAMIVAQAVSLLLNSWKETDPLLQYPERFDQGHGAADPERTKMIHRVWTAAWLGMVDFAGAALALMVLSPSLTVLVALPGIVSLVISLLLHTGYDRHAEIPTAIVIKNRPLDTTGETQGKGYATIQIVRELDDESQKSLLRNTGFKIDGNYVWAGMINNNLTLFVEGVPAERFGLAMDGMIDTLKGFANVRGNGRAIAVLQNLDADFSSIDSAVIYDFTGGAVKVRVDRDAVLEFSREKLPSYGALRNILRAHDFALAREEAIESKWSAGYKDLEALNGSIVMEQKDIENNARVEGIAGLRNKGAKIYVKYEGDSQAELEELLKTYHLDGALVVRGDGTEGAVVNSDALVQNVGSSVDLVLSGPNVKGERGRGYIELDLGDPADVQSIKDGKIQPGTVVKVKVDERNIRKIEQLNSLPGNVILVFEGAAYREVSRITGRDIMELNLFGVNLLAALRITPRTDEEKQTYEERMAFSLEFGDGVNPAEALRGDKESLAGTVTHILNGEYEKVENGSLALFMESAAAHDRTAADAGSFRAAVAARLVLAAQGKQYGLESVDQEDTLVEMMRKLQELGSDFAVEAPAELVRSGTIKGTEFEQLKARAREGKADAVRAVIELLSLYSEQKVFFRAKDFKFEQLNVNAIRSVLEAA